MKFVELSEWIEIKIKVKEQQRWLRRKRTHHLGSFTHLPFSRVCKARFSGFYHAQNKQTIKQQQEQKQNIKTKDMKNTARQYIRSNDIELDEKQPKNHRRLAYRRI